MIPGSYQSLRVEVLDASAAGFARRSAASLAGRHGFSVERQNDVALIVTEAATNLVQHAGGGEILVRALAGSAQGIELIALDKGPGMANVTRCLEDGFSTGGSRGVGLGSIARLSESLDIYSLPDRGTVLVARAWSDRQHRRLSAGAICVACRGEDVSGDGWALEHRSGTATLLVVDGLGHGLPAHEAASEAIRSFESTSPNEPGAVLERIHRAIHKTRGAAGAVLSIDWNQGIARFVGVGNVAGSLTLDDKSQSLPSHNGILGQRQPRFQEFTYPCPGGSLAIVHSDGLSARFSLSSYPGLAYRDPALVAAVLYRDFARRRDDNTVVVLRNPNAPDAPMGGASTA